MNPSKLKKNFQNKITTFTLFFRYLDFKKFFGNHKLFVCKQGISGWLTPEMFRTLIGKYFS